MSMHEQLKELNIMATQTGDYLCPQCSHTRRKSNVKCMHVAFQDDRILYRCNHCEFNGCIFENKFDTKKIVKKKYRKPVLPPERTDKQKMEDWFMNDRLINKATLDIFKIGLSEKNETIFPYYKDGELVNIKYRSADKKFRQEAETEKTLFGMDLIKDDYLIWTEGEIDAMSFQQEGYPAISVPQGAGENKLECINNCFEFLEKFSFHIIAVDSDEAGDKLRNNLIQRLGKEKCKVVDWSVYGVKDCNEALVKDKRVLKEIIEKAEFVPIEGIATCESVYNEFMDFYHNGYSSGVSTGWNNLDEIFKIKTRNLMIITGIPTRGKSYFSDNLLFNLTKNSGWKHLICSFENSFANHLSRFAELKYGKQFNKGGGKYAITEDEAKEAVGYFNDYIYRIEVNRMWNIDDILKVAEYSVRRFGVKTVTIDPYNRLKHPKVDRQDIYIGEILSKLKTFAEKHDVLVIFIAHPKKMSDSDSAPSMYDISGSPDWYNMADYGITIHRDRDDDGKLSTTTEVIIHKVKDFHLGNPSGGNIKLGFKYRRLVEE